MAWTLRPRAGVVIDFGLVEDDVTVGLGGDGEVTLSDVLPDPRPGHPAKVEETDPSMTDSGQIEPGQGTLPRSGVQAGRRAQTPRAPTPAR
jgi:hypothetical protein